MTDSGEVIGGYRKEERMDQKILAQSAVDHYPADTDSNMGRGKTDL